MEKLLMIGEAARAIGRSVETLRHYDRTGKLPAIKTSNGRRLFRETDVKKLASKIQEEVRK
jgi:DNA-binding transcriptional MerR regulator